MEAKEQYQQYLLPNEQVEFSATLGFHERFKLYHVVLTNLRLLVIKTFPKNLIELEYKDLEIVEYYTNVAWLQLIYAAFLFFVAVLFFLNHSAILDKFRLFFPPAEPILYAGNFFGLTAGAFIVLAVLLIAGIYFCGWWVLSLFGRFRILIYHQAPLEIVTGLTPGVQDLIKRIELKKRAARSNVPSTEHLS
ncbi:MAG TPA: hypothetical protein VJK52_00350 [Candidatus Nanoarchaeia archaeon]|nr:hypothetical protein [Candidatus Nanoarchaeia archaeon]